MSPVALAEIRIGRRHRKDMGDLTDLIESMRALGLLQPIGITPDKELVFGERRLRAAQALEWATIPARIVKVDQLLAEQDENVVRKEFTVSERVAIAEAIRERISERRGRPGKKPQKLAEIDPGTETRDYAAIKSGLGNHETYRQAKAVVDRGTPELVRAMDSGALAINVASRLAEQPHDRQAKIVRMLAAGEARTVQQADRRVAEQERASLPVPERVDARVLHGDAVELVRGLEQRPHLVVTDPPYGIECHNTRRSPGPNDYADGAGYAFDLLERLCAALVERVDPSAHLYFFSGYTHVHRMKELLQQFFEVQDNELIWVKDGHTMADFAKRYPNRNERIWFCRMRGSHRRLARCVSDVLTFNRERSSTHTAEKPVELLSLLIEQSSVPGELVLDPFAGSGSTGVAARRLSRQFVGIERDAHWCGVARDRLAAVKLEGAA